MVFAASACRASTSFVTASPDGVFVLRPSDTVYLRPFRAPVRSSPRTDARSPALGAGTSAALCFGFVCFGFLASRLDRFCPLDICSSYYPLRSVKEGIWRFSGARENMLMFSCGS